MANLMTIYEESMRALQQRHEELEAQYQGYTKRMALLEEEIDELWEAMRMMRPYLEG